MKKFIKIMLAIASFGCAIAALVFSLIDRLVPQAIICGVFVIIFTFNFLLALDGE